jgi:uncharacterized protein with PQ loop repeat
VTAVAVNVPQTLRLLRTRTAAGMDLAAMVNSAISFFAWTAYALWIQDGWILAGSALGLPGAVLAAWLTWRCGAARDTLWLPALWSTILACSALLDLVGGRGTLPFVIGASVVWLVVPAVVTAWRSHDVTGIAPGFWWVLVVEGSLFLGYGLLAAQRVAIVYGVVTLAGSFAVLARVGYTRRFPPSHLAGLDLDEGRPDDTAAHAAPTHVDTDLVPVGDAAVEQGERDALLQRRGEGAGRRVSHHLPVDQYLHLGPWHTTFERQQAASEARRPLLLLGE